MVTSKDFEEVLNENLVSFLQKYLLHNAYSDSGFLTLHGASVLHNNEAVVFLANSMVGKSTLSAFLCSKDCTYITDDRIIIDTKRNSIVPFAKPIMLRPEGKELLKKQYNLELESVQFRCGKIWREIVTPKVSMKECAPVKCIYILSREENTKLFRTIVKREDRIRELVAYNLAINDLKKTKELIQLSEVRMEKVFFSNLNDIYDSIIREEMTK